MPGRRTHAVTGVRDGPWLGYAAPELIPFRLKGSGFCQCRYYSFGFVVLAIDADRSILVALECTDSLL